MKHYITALIDAFIRSFSIFIFSEYCVSVYMVSDSSHELIVFFLSFAFCLISFFLFSKSIMECPKWGLLLFNTFLFFVIGIGMRFLVFLLPNLRVFPILDNDVLAPGLGFYILSGCFCFVCFFILEKVFLVIAIILKLKNQKNDNPGTVSD